MVKWSGPKRVKVQMTVYVHPKVKQGMMILATLEHLTVSKLVEQMCIDELRDHPEVARVIEKGE